MKTNKNYLIALCALAISAVSCVDDSVSPQVEAIRAQQVEFMKAKTLTEQAMAEFQKAEAAYKNGLAAVQNANAAEQIRVTAFDKENSVWTLKLAELNYKVAEANQKALLKNAETALVTAESNLAIAMVAMKTAAAASAIIKAAAPLPSRSSARHVSGSRPVRLDSNRLKQRERLAQALTRWTRKRPAQPGPRNPRRECATRMFKTELMASSR